jgi:hypothetical protein
MSWNYRVLDHDGELAIYEVYYEDDGKVKGHSLLPAIPKGNDINELNDELALYRAALNSPVLKYT